MSDEVSTNASASKNAEKKSKVPFIIVGIVALLAILTVLYTVSYKKKSSQGGGFLGFGGVSGAGQTVVTVRTQEASKSVLHDYVNTNGEIETQSSIDVFPDIGGKIVSVSVSLGTTVKRGDEIAEVDPSVPGTEYKHSIVTAPISGTITKSPLKTGTTVNTASTITVIGDVSNLQITANVPERYVSVLKTGLKADITLEAYPDSIFTSTVTRVSPVVDSTSRTKEIILNFDKKDPRVNAGMFAKVKLWTQDYSGAITIPSGAIVEKNDTSNVYVIKDGKAELRPVTLGKNVDNVVQILTGLTEGERVVVEGIRVVSDGVSVHDIAL